MTHHKLANEEDSLRQCSKCHITKPLDKFEKVKSTSTGRGLKCNSCVNAYHRNRYHTIGKSKKMMMNERWRVKNLDKVNKARRERTSTTKWKMEQKARHAVHSAVKSGELIKEKCRDCTSDKVDFHHTNGYDVENCLVGVWLCRMHHAAEHVKIRTESYERA